ncbi:fused MFS/spermidine synthase [Ectothiorhodospiraceae bacterium 2226]|nr:fused MFS/spermidine synthase [Ectothiorhodospiraceae bacterium 2226]
MWYGAVVFVSSAFLLVLEIVAGRLLAPYVGVSLYTWTSIIGVILAGLSLGNWLGGLWADRGGDEQAVGLTLGLAGLFSLAILPLLTLVAPMIETRGLGLLSASFFYVLALFFIPGVLLGVITPLLTTIALRLDARAGHVVGRMHALAALGAILGTFITGFVLIQYVGTRNVIVGTGIGLLVLAAPFLLRARRAVPAALVAGLVLIASVGYARGALIDPCERESSYFCIRVVDEPSAFGPTRALVLDYLKHGANSSQHPALFVAPYVHLMDELVLHHFGRERAGDLNYFFAGGGAYTLPRGIRHLRPQAGITVAEIDPLVTRVAAEKLFVDTADMRILHEDARMALGRNDTRYDVVFGDAFHDISIPYHLVTREYNQLVKSRLTEHGIYILNVLDAFPNAELVKTMVNTLERDFAHVAVWMEFAPSEPTRMTYVISASDAHAPPEFIRPARQGGGQRGWLRVNEPLFQVGLPREQLPVLTDDFVPVERLVSGFFFDTLGN